MTPYKQTNIKRMRQEWLEWRLPPLFLFIFPTFLWYHIHLPWRADMDINLADYGCKEINITDIWDAYFLPILLDITIWPSIWKCWLILSMPLAVNSVGDLVIFSLTRTTLWLSLHMINLLLYFPGRLRVSRSTGIASWMPWYVWSMIVRVTYLNWLLTMGVARTKENPYASIAILA